MCFFDVQLKNVLIPYFVIFAVELYFVSFSALEARFMNFHCSLHPRRNLLAGNEEEGTRNRNFGRKLIPTFPKVG